MHCHPLIFTCHPFIFTCLHLPTASPLKRSRANPIALDAALGGDHLKRKFLWNQLRRAGLSRVDGPDGYVMEVTRTRDKRAQYAHPLNAFGAIFTLETGVDPSRYYRGYAGYLHHMIDYPTKCLDPRSWLAAGCPPPLHDLDPKHKMAFGEVDGKEVEELRAALRSAVILTDNLEKLFNTHFE